MHHTALSALALWFAATTKLDWAMQYPRDSQLAHQLEVAVLPALSTANIRELLKAVLPQGGSIRKIVSPEGDAIGPQASSFSCPIHQLPTEESAQRTISKS